MVLGPERLLPLMNHGLSESESRAYLALIEHPQMTAAALGKVANVPRSHLYKVLEDLQGHSLVDIILEEGVRTYRARPFKQFLELRAAELRAHLAEIEAQATTLGAALNPPQRAGSHPTAGQIRLIIGRRMVAREIDDLIGSARNEIVIAASDRSVDRVASQLASFNGRWSSGAIRPPRVTIILPAGAGWPPDVNVAAQVSSVRRFKSERGVMSFVADEDRLLVIRPIPDGGDVRAGRDVAFFSDDAAFVKGHKQLLLGASTGSTSPEFGSFE